MYILEDYEVIGNQVLLALDIIKGKKHDLIGVANEKDKASKWMEVVKKGSMVGEEVVVLDVGLEPDAVGHGHAPDQHAAEAGGGVESRAAKVALVLRLVDRRGVERPGVYRAVTGHDAGRGLDGSGGGASEPLFPDIVEEGSVIVVSVEYKDH